MQARVTIVWICCSDGRSSVELFTECERAYTVRRCHPSGALSTLANVPPTIVVIDYSDPSAADLYLLQSVKRQFPALPILMLTDTHSEELAVWAMRARVWNYLVKPLPLRELKSNLQQLARLPTRENRDSREVMRPATILPVHRTADSRGKHAVVRRIAEEIRRDSGRRGGRGIGHLASNCGVSRFALSRTFKQDFGITYREFIMRKRLQDACKLLEQPGASVTSVAYAAGFTDASYFARVFKRHLRICPLKYIQAARMRAQSELIQEATGS